MAFINLNEPAASFPRVPTGSLIKTNNKFGHELIAGPLVDGQQVVGHKEPGVGTHIELIDEAAQRYPFAEIVAPVNDYHGAASWWRMEQQLGEQWDLLNNCQHGARRAYYGRAESPSLLGWGAAAGLALLWWFDRD